MVHSGFEATSVNETVRRPWRALSLALRGVRTEGEMAPEIPLEGQRPAVYVFEGNVSGNSQRCGRPRPRKRPGRRPPQRCSARNAALLSRAAAQSPVNWPESG